MSHPVEIKIEHHMSIEELNRAQKQKKLAIGSYLDSIYFVLQRIIIQE